MMGAMLPEADQFRRAIVAVIDDRYKSRGIKGFANDHKIPYDRVLAHLSGETRSFPLQALIQYMEALGLDFPAVFAVIDALDLTEQRAD